MHFVLLNLDPINPLSHTTLQDVRSYLQAFFCVEIKIAEVPRTPIAPEVPSGWEALRERTHHPVQSRPGRTASDKQQICAPHLLTCLRLARENPTKYGVEVEDCECILGLTKSEFYESGAGLLPDEPAPADRTQDVFVGSTKHGVGACTFAHLEQHENRIVAQRRLLRQLCTLVSNSILALLGLRTCPSHMCVAYFKPMQLGKTPMGLCFRCEEKLIQKVESTQGPQRLQTLIRLAATRYANLGEALNKFSHKTEKVKLGYRRYKEFEEQIDWLQMAEEILQETERERFFFQSTEGPQRRRRCLLNCLREAHERQPMPMLHRTLSEPFFKKTCLVDMSQSAPFRHESGPLDQWCSAVINRKHTSGGFYVELGGSLRSKTVSCFVESGLNASMLPQGPDIARAMLAKSMTKTMSLQTAAAATTGGTERMAPRKALTTSTVPDKMQKRRRNAMSLNYTVKSME